VNLIGANLGEADLSPANLGGTDFSEADLREANLGNAELSKARLRGADLFQADLIQARLRGADLSGADLSWTVFFRANLSEALLIDANLTCADLRQAHLTWANLTGADLSQTLLIQTHLEGANLSNARIHGIAAWDLQLDQATKQTGLVITRDNQPTITVDSLEVAQFVYLLLNNQRIRDVIDTIGKKAVLILGRFTADRKVVLDSLRDELRTRGFLPILFDFNKPASSTLTETIRTLTVKGGRVRPLASVHDRECPRVQHVNHAGGTNRDVQRRGGRRVPDGIRFSCDLYAGYLAITGQIYHTHDTRRPRTPTGQCDRHPDPADQPRVHRYAPPPAGCQMPAPRRTPVLEY
jgi:hypothetical protein